MARHRHVPTELYAVPSIAQPLEWMDYTLRELDRYVRCRSCGLVGLRNRVRAVYWFTRGQSADELRRALVWKRSLFSFV